MLSQAKIRKKAKEPERSGDRPGDGEDVRREAWAESVTSDGVTLSSVASASGCGSPSSAPWRRVTCAEVRTRSARSGVASSMRGGAGDVRSTSEGFLPFRR